MSPNKLFSTVIVTAVLCATSLYAHGDAKSPETSSSEKLGTVHFETSCTPAAQEQFDRAITRLHSFFYPDSVKAFTAVAETDPKCAIAYWGIAVSTRPNPLVGPFDAATLKKGLDAVEKGKAIGAGTQRERDYLSAIEPFYKDFDKLDQKTRTIAYVRAMEKLYFTYRDDPEAAVFFALALNESAPANDKTYSNQLIAAAILEQVAAVQPDHPGVLHYLIHSYDYEPLATRGLPAANRYAAIAPSAPHALHMPSHIYSMLGMWDESIRSNQASIIAANDYAAKTWPGAAHPGALHATDFMTYAYLQEGQDRNAKGLVDEVSAVNTVGIPSLAADTALAAIPARYALERGEWSEAAALEIRPTAYPQAEGITRFARAIGSARSGDSSGAQEEIERLRAIRDSLKQSKQDFWADQTEIQIRAASAWVEHLEGADGEALELMRSAADLDDASGKHVAMENKLLPMRELLGYMLLELEEPAKALKEFETALRESPNRLRGYYGAAKAAELSGNIAKAQTFYGSLAALGAHADGERAELREAMTFLASKGKGKNCVGC